MSILLSRQEAIKKLTDEKFQFPPNEAENPQVLTFVAQLRTDHIWPQILQRQPFEKKWDEALAMYKCQRDRTRSRQRTKPQSSEKEDQKEDKEPELGETIVFDTVDRLKNLNYFISWKEQPAQFNKPRYTFTPLEDQFYSPTSKKLKSANAILEQNNEMQNVKDKHHALAQHYYLYGIAFVHSEYVFEIDSENSSDEYLLIKNIGTTFSPISVRRVFLNVNIPVDEMEKQACPFFFELTTRAQILQNVYHPQFNPTGFVNLTNLHTAEAPSAQETESWRKGLPPEAQGTLQNRPEFSGESLWTFFPFVGASRYVLQIFTNNLLSGRFTVVRFQKLTTPNQRLPLYGQTAIPDLDSGLYPPSIAQILEHHYDELVKSKHQFLLNKDWINNPPSWAMSGTPSANQDCNKPGAKIEVTGPNDFGWRTPFDATQTTIAFYQLSRDQAQTTGKMVDAVLGKAMGGRTTATEASNAFQASMSGVTSDVDRFCTGFYKPYAQRTWENCGRYMDIDMIRKICNNDSLPPLDPQDFLLNIGIKTDVGSTFIESIVKQQHYQYAIQYSQNNPSLDQGLLWKAFFEEIKLPRALDAVLDNGKEFEIEKANKQAVDTYLGRPVLISPSQNHEIAMRVKQRYLEDHESMLNREYAGQPSPYPNMLRAQFLAMQIQMHQQFVMLQTQQQMLQMQAAAEQQAAIENPPQPEAKPE